MNYNKYFDHTLLKADASLQEIKKLCEEAKKYDFMSVCVNPFYVPVAKRLLKGSNVKVCTVIGFPLGQMSPAAKAAEAKDAVFMGADEVDMVQNVAMAKSGDYEFVEREIRAVKEAVGDTLLKVILETCYLDPQQIRCSCIAAVKGGADYVKTSTGFGKGGAKAEDIHLMRCTVGPNIGVKASGGIHSKDDMMAMIKNGATRIGASASVQIMEELEAK